MLHLEELNITATIRAQGFSGISLAGLPPKELVALPQKPHRSKWSDGEEASGCGTGALCSVWLLVTLFLAEDGRKEMAGLFGGCSCSTWW